ncbi:hypothetical protein M8C21_018882 [Ambrosia artemisiifolia]|uniref:Secreted protein n=1 Tax=Ambrosia artemisiifolia TaxID=4212 RepID=A0AAD5G267_AMBAR|nr:hypothetical protein M8C21_018882 [Ambrosia artemisiifolia]
MVFFFVVKSVLWLSPAEASLSLTNTASMSCKEIYMGASIEIQCQILEDQRLIETLISRLGVIVDHGLHEYD